MQFINPSQPPAADPDALLPPIELREYLFVVFRHWRVVAVMVFVAALVSAGAGVFGAKTYSAVATIAVTDTRIQPQQVLAAGAHRQVQPHEAPDARADCSRPAVACAGYLER
jgi:uncharacterized protein involved in exopolysaccharide biosynthesis